VALSKRRPSQPEPDRQPDNAGAAPDWRARYEIPNPAEVDAYVAQHPVVAGILSEAPTELVAAFEEDVRLVLQYELDHDDEPASDYLAVDIMTMRDTNDAYDRLQHFDARWWIDDALPRAARAGATVVFMLRPT
jgi:hypothetical protein